MKCPHCGGEISLEQKYCPYCGNLNEAARRHVADMENYQEAYEQTETELRQKTQRFAGVMMRIVVLAVMILIMIALLYVSFNYYSIHSRSLSRQADRNYDSYSQILDDYLEQRDYMDFYAFTQAKGIRTYNSKYEDYGPLYWSASDYNMSYDYLMNLVCGQDPERNISYLCTSLSSFYRFGEESRWDEIEDEQKRSRYREYYQGMSEDLHGLLKVYLELTDEQVENLPEMSEMQRGILFEEQTKKLYPEAYEEEQS